jgi:hypothetical protein
MILSLVRGHCISIPQMLKTLLIVMNRLKLRSFLDLNYAIFARRAAQQLCYAIGQQWNRLKPTARSRRRDRNDEIGCPVSGLGKIGSSLTQIGSYRFIGVIFEPV